MYLNSWWKRGCPTNTHIRPLFFIMAPVGMSDSEPSLLRAESEGRRDGWIYDQPVLMEGGGGDDGNAGGGVEAPAQGVCLPRATPSAANKAI